MNRSRRRFGNHAGTPDARLVVDVKTIEISANRSASQVMTPTVNSNLMMALVRMKGFGNRVMKKK